MKIYETKAGKSFKTPFLLVSSLFFLWGFAHAILEVLNPHFKDLMNLSHENAAWVQAATYTAYFLMALPAGWIIRRHGYRSGVLTGLVLYGIGALLFLPICLLGDTIGSINVLYACFVGALFVIGCGLTCLETSANPYVTVLGDPSSAERRINLSQSLNGFGWICGPLVGGLLFFGGSETESAAAAEGTSSVLSVAIPYTVVGIAVLLVALVFKRSELPEVTEDESPAGTDKVGGELPLIRNGMFVFGVISLFLYVAAQTGVNSNFVSYMVSNGDMTKETASLWLSFGGMGLFMVGRILGSWLMNYIRAERLMGWLGIGATVAAAVVVTSSGFTSMSAFLVIYLCESIMFPTIFALSLRGLAGSQTKLASSILIMTIVGGAIAPLLMGRIADAVGISMAFLVPLVCYIVITVFSFSVKKR